MKYKFPHLLICSYNLYWELFVKENRIKLQNISDVLIQKYKNNTLSNIKLTNDFFEPQIFCFQEVVNYTEIIKLFPSNYKNTKNKSKNEKMLTIFDEKWFNLIDYKSGEFEQGRPFIILLLEDKINKYYFLLINIHSGHKKNTSTSIFEPLQKKINSFPKINLDKVTRIIISGDFNRDIKIEIKDKLFKYQLFIGNKIYNFKFFNNTKSTCCTIYGNTLNKNYDHIIESNSKPLLTYNLNLQPWYKYPSSDHVLVLAIIKN